MPGKQECGSKRDEYRKEERWSMTRNHSFRRKRNIFLTISAEVFEEGLRNLGYSEQSERQGKHRNLSASFSHFLDSI